MKTKLRMLTEQELELVSGGDIVVTGKRPGGGGGWPWWDWGTGGYDDDGGGDYDGGGGGGDTSDPPPPEDTDEIEVTVNIDRPLTPSEQQAVEDLEAEIAQTTETINNLDDNAQIRLENGEIVTGAELKEIWSKTDFVINEVGFTYENGTMRGEAAFNNGNPQVSYNIDIVEGFNAHAGGLTYLVLHEVGHLTQASRDHLDDIYSDGVLTDAEEAAHERLANDIAAAIANSAGTPILTDSFFGNSATIPVFTVPSGTGGSGSGSGGSGSGSGSGSGGSGSGGYGGGGGGGGFGDPNVNLY